MLFNQEKALVWEFFEIGYINKDITLPLKIKTILYKVWQILNFFILRAL